MHRISKVDNRFQVGRVARDESRRYGEPWFVDYPWNPRGIRDRAGLHALGGLWVTMFLVVFLAPLNWWAFGGGSGPLVVKLCVGLVDAILVFVAGTALYRLAQFLRYGHSRLEFRGFPFHPGGQLQVGFSGTRLAEVKATLRFVEERIVARGRGPSRTTTLDVYEHYREENTFRAPESSPGIEITFTIPPHPEWVTAMSAVPVRYWELVVESESRGVDFRTAFPLPVYARS